MFVHALTPAPSTCFLRGLSLCALALAVACLLTT